MVGSLARVSERNALRLARSTLTTEDSSLSLEASYSQTASSEPELEPRSDSDGSD